MFPLEHLRDQKTQIIENFTHVKIRFTVARVDKYKAPIYEQVWILKKPEAKDLGMCSFSFSKRCSV